MRAKHGLAAVLSRILALAGSGAATPEVGRDGFAFVVVTQSQSGGV
jgi:hypothetical protein